MKVKDLIAHLQKLPQEYDVLVYDSDQEHYCDLDKDEIKAGKAIKKVLSEYLTHYWDTEFYEVKDPSTVMDAVLIGF